ncbi:PIN-like domain-containing protein [Aliarcobacter butzleri]|uniref:PIN-like domain-containing protein n=1 Tax=Aliarcobacter butzleri TaxID=28197 RepID=UPI003BAEF4A9
MENIFKGFHETSDAVLKEIWNEEYTLFVFDTNVLLNLYRYGEQTRKDFFKVLNDIKNIWIPYHVGLEYQRNRISVIKNEKKVFNDLKKYLSNLKKEINSSSIEELKLSERLPLVNKENDSFKKSILELISNYENFINEENKKQPEVRSGDKIRKDIYKVFDTKVGNKPNNQEWLDCIYKDGEIRYKNNIPPGYKDKDKSNSDDNLFSYSDLNYNSKFGDLIIWKQIIEKANDDNIKNIIFISDDIKEDWRYIVESNGKKIIGCRAELREEIFTKSNIDNFLILQSFELLKTNNKISKNKIDKDSIVEIEKTSNHKIVNNRDKIIDILNRINEQNEKYTSSKIMENLNRLNEQNEKYTPSKLMDILNRLNEQNEKYSSSKIMENLNRLNEQNEKYSSSKLMENLNRLNEQNEKYSSSKLMENLNRLNEQNEKYSSSKVIDILRSLDEKFNK